MGYHYLGKKFLEENKNFERVKIYGNKIIELAAPDIGISTRSIHYAIQFAKKYPNINSTPEGKNITWNKLITLYLPAPKENKVDIIAPPKGKYEVIVIDPPWPYGTEYNSDSRRVASPYHELSLEEITKMEIPSADNSAIWLWTTHKFLPNSFDLLKNWGFEYKITFVWDKQKLGMGAWLRCQAEFALLGIKGHPKWNLTNQRDVLSVGRKEHSRKPDDFYKLVESLTPSKHKLDIFSREKRNGWQQYGNETEKF